MQLPAMARYLPRAIVAAAPLAASADDAGSRCAIAGVAGAGAVWKPVAPSAMPPAAIEDRATRAKGFTRPGASRAVPWVPGPGGRLFFLLVDVVTALAAERRHLGGYRCGVAGLDRFGQIRGTGDELVQTFGEVRPARPDRRPGITTGHIGLERALRRRGGHRQDLREGSQIIRGRLLLDDLIDEHHLLAHGVHDVLTVVDSVLIVGSRSPRRDDRRKRQHRCQQREATRCSAASSAATRCLGGTVIHEASP